MDKMPLSNIQDSSKFTEKHPDSGVTSDTDGGYVTSRARFTRRARIVWTTGFTEISSEEKTELTEFYHKIKGSAKVFQWWNPQTLEWINVRFSGDLDWTYDGIGYQSLWSTKFTLVEA